MKAILATASVAALVAGTPLAAAPAPVAASIDITRRATPVSAHEYGMFIEPIGGLVNRTLWAELLDDRKFYYPVVSPAHDTPPPLNAEGKPGVEYRKWRPVGADDAVTMDTAAPYVGAQSPSVTLAGSAPRGLAQSGFAVLAGKRYTGHLWISGDAGASVQVALVWGTRADQRQSIALPAPAAGWRQADFAFTPTAGTADARLEITGTGTGRFRIGAVSLMPADNINGWRADTTAVARSLKSGFWRLPGGNFLSDWDWHEALGPRDQRAPMFDHAWSAMQTNDLGMDEWMELCRIIGVEPYVTVNAGLGDANSAAEEVEYLNGAATSDWGAKRAANGHAEPYKVKWWNIGNEPFGWWQIGKTSLDYYTIKHNDFAAKMRARDPSIVLIASGAMPDQLHAKGVKQNSTLESIQPKFGTEEDWTGGLFARSWGNFAGITEHWYDRGEDRPDAPPADALMEFVRSPSNHVRMEALEWGIYQQRFPKLKDSGVFLSIDEYAYMAGPPTLKSSLAYASVFQEMLRHTDFLKMAAFTTGVSTMNITPEGATLNATGMVFKLFGEHFGAGTIPVALDGASPQPEPRYPIGYAHPKVVAGSPTYPLDVIAGLSPDGTMLRVAVVNATFQPQRLALSLADAKLRGSGTRWLLAGKTLAAENKVGKPAGVTIRESKVSGAGRGLIVPPTSAAIYELPLTR
ncbi:alpha-L-arabinofuranosidase C-terminal domain-containing protein [Sphingomonas sp. GC_Shp_3]|uniref:alpha-L-arabinofuranosidase C-terminal domain-containing protein n=1 Tax=Sphingomonas sp. GC_Shp_3 TaxID=2937383 RepID=UPI00226AD575|nr:alpha-L-arabinofuranosidase C-terminal domain-containing protein [Sphingomonas sp. GC_Shp_3]